MAVKLLTEHHLEFLSLKRGCTSSYESTHVKILLFDFINLTQVHNFMVSAQDIFTFSRLSLFTVSFTGILQVAMR